MKNVTILMALLFLAGLGSSGVVTFDNNWGTHPLFNITGTRMSGIDITFSMHQMVIEAQVVDGVSMQSFGMPAVFIPDPGVPNLGGVSRWLAVPQGARAQVVILDSRTEVYQNVEIAPAPNIPRDNDNASLKYEKNMAIYSKNAYWPSSPVVVGQKTDLRGVDVVLLSVMPFQYNPVTKELIVYKDIKFRVDYVGGSGHFGIDRLRSRHWEPVLANNLINYSQLQKIDYYSPQRLNSRAGFEYIIIVPDDATFIAWGDTLKRWRKLQGISTEVYTTTQCGGNDSAHIKTFLQNAYNTWDPAPVAFLILSDFNPSGDVYGVAAARLVILGETVASDNWYADMNADNLPDLDHGRICAQTNAHLDTIIHKMLAMERNPTTNTHFYDYPIVAAAWQTERWFQLCGEVVRGFLMHGLSKPVNRLYAIYSGTPVVGGPWSSRQGTTPTVQYWYNAGWLTSLTNTGDAAWWSNGNNTLITQGINDGAYLVQHRDHGGETLWGEPAYSNSDVYNNTNTNSMYPYINSSNCLTGKYIYSSECMTERFHRDTHCAVGINAASEVSYSFVNDAYIWGIWDGLYPQFDAAYPNFDMTGYYNMRPCQAMSHGKIYLHAMWFADSAGLGTGDYRRITDHLFHHHGDCFMTLNSIVPLTLSVSHPPTLLAGATSFPVSANDSSVIALTVNGEIIGTAMGTGSTVNVAIPAQTPGTTVKVTVTRWNYRRYEADVQVVSSAYPYVTVVTMIINDSGGDGVINPGESVNWGVYGKNVGQGTAQQVYGLLSESNTYVTVTNDSAWFGNIAQNDSALSNPYYVFNVASNTPNNTPVNFTIQFYDINDSIWTSYKTLSVYAPILTYQSHQVTGGNGNGILDPGETANLIVTIKNEGGAVANSVTSTLIEASPYITIGDASGNFGNINPGNTANNSGDPYTVTASGSTPTGTVVPFQIRVVSGIYVDTLDFTLVVGRKHYYLWNPDDTPTPGQYMHTALQALGYSGDYGTSLAADLTMYQAVLVTLGIYPNEYIILSGSAEATRITNFLQSSGGRVYMEGSCWYIDPTYFGGHNFNSLFGIAPINYYYNQMGPMSGKTGTFTNGMSFTYTGEVNYNDYGNATGTGYVIFDDANNAYHIAFANNAGTYRTVGSCFELGCLNDATPPSTRSALIDSIMKFFGCVPPVGIEEAEGLMSPGTKFGLRVFPTVFQNQLILNYGLGQSAKNPVLKIYDTSGRLVIDLSARLAVDGSRSTVVWSSTDQSGRRVPAGVYFVRLEANGQEKIEKAILLR